MRGPGVAARDYPRLSELSDLAGLSDPPTPAPPSPEQIKRAIELNPKQPHCRHLYGRWLYEVSGIGWIARQAAAALFSDPPAATYEEAIEQFLMAEDYSGGSIWRANKLYLGKCYVALGRSAEARTWLEKAM